MIHKIKITKLIKEYYEVEADTMDNAISILNENLKNKRLDYPVRLIKHEENIMSEKGIYGEYKEENF